MRIGSRALLATTGSDLVPWLIAAGVVVVLGIIALVVSNVVRERRSADKIADAAIAETGAEGPETPAESNDSGDAGSISPDDPR